MSHFARGRGAPPRIYGHRGTRLGAPENTLRAMELALSQGADGIELDVRLCGSGEPVVVHDADLTRVAGVPLRVATEHLSAVRAVTLGQGERVPLLADALALVLEADHLLNIELKTDDTDIDELVTSVLASVQDRPAAQRERVLYSSFSAAACAALARSDPHAQIAFLFDRPIATVPFWARALHPHHGCVSAAMDLAHAPDIDLTVNAWTVNDPTLAKTLAQVGVDGIITDNVPLIRAHILQ